MPRPPRPSPDDIDPKRVDVATAPRRRRVRAKPEPSGALAATKPDRLSRALKRPLTPSVMFEPDSQGGYEITAPHSDRGLWELEIADALATRSPAVMRTFTSHLCNLCTKAWDEPNGRWKPNESELTAILAMVADAQPKTIAQAALVAQAVAVHILTMKLAKDAFNSGGMVMTQEAALMGKLARTYAMQMTALAEMQGKRRTSRQTIKVTKELHQHVHYYTNTPGEQKNEGRPHGPSAETIEGSAALPGEEPGGKVLRLPSRSRPRGVL